MPDEGEKEEGKVSRRVGAAAEGRKKFKAARGKRWLTVIEDKANINYLSIIDEQFEGNHFLFLYNILVSIKPMS